MQMYGLFYLNVVPEKCNICTMFSFFPKVVGCLMGTVPYVAGC